MVTEHQYKVVTNILIKWWCHLPADKAFFVLTLVKHLPIFRMKTDCWMPWHWFHARTFSSGDHWRF